MRYAKLNQAWRLKHLNTHATAPQSLLIFSLTKLIMRLIELQSLSARISQLCGPYEWPLM